MRDHRGQRGTWGEREAAREGAGRTNPDGWGGIAERGAGSRHRAVCRAKATDDYTVSLFEPDALASSQDDATRPLAERMRPGTLEEYAGQAHILAPGKPLRSQIDRDQLGSIILWGPPGVGKTTLARIIARMTHADFIPFSAVLSGIKEIKAVMADAERNRRLGRRTLIFIDEIHRFNKAQQDAFLPYVERGDIILIGATTENPSFEVISALLSRTKVYMLKPLAEDEIVRLLERALGMVKVTASEDLLRQIAVYSNGDA